MDCRKAEDLILADYCDGELHGGALQELEVHLRGCLSCRSLYERTDNIDKLLRGGVASNPPERIWVSVQERIDLDRTSIWEKFGWVGSLFVGESRRLAFSATIATVIIILGVALPTVFLSPVSYKKEVHVSEATFASVGAFMSEDDELWAESVEHFLL